MRYFTYLPSGKTQIRGKHGNLYNFYNGTITPVPYEDDAEWFLHMGTPEKGVDGYQFRETDVSGKPIGLFPPVDPRLRVSQLDTRQFPSDRGLPPAPVWREITETLADPTLYFHHIRKRIR